MPSSKPPKRSSDDTAIGLLARREHSRVELARKLEQRGFERDEIDATLDRLAEQRLQSDVRFAEAFVRQSIARGHGPMKIRARLGQRGVDEAVGDAAFAEHACDWFAQARAVRHKRFGASLPETYKERARQARFLSTRGFSAEHIASVLHDD